MASAIMNGSAIVSATNAIANGSANAIAIDESNSVMYGFPKHMASTLRKMDKVLQHDETNKTQRHKLYWSGEKISLDTNILNQYANTLDATQLRELHDNFKVMVKYCFGAMVDYNVKPIDEIRQYFIKIMSSFQRDDHYNSLEYDFCFIKFIQPITLYYFYRSLLPSNHITEHVINDEYINSVFNIYIDVLNIQCKHNIKIAERMKNKKTMNKIISCWSDKQYYIPLILNTIINYSRDVKSHNTLLRYCYNLLTFNKNVEDSALSTALKSIKQYCFEDELHSTTFEFDIGDDRFREIFMRYMRNSICTELINKRKSDGINIHINKITYPRADLELGILEEDYNALLEYDEDVVLDNIFNTVIFNNLGFSRLFAYLYSCFPIESIVRKLSSYDFNRDHCAMMNLFMFALFSNSYELLEIFKAFNPEFIDVSIVEDNGWTLIEQYSDKNFLAIAKKYVESIDTSKITKSWTRFIITDIIEKIDKIITGDKKDVKKNSK